MEIQGWQGTNLNTLLVFTQKIQAVRESQAEHLQQLKESLDQKQKKAEKVSQFHFLIFKKRFYYLRHSNSKKDVVPVIPVYVYSLLTIRAPAKTMDVKEIKRLEAEEASRRQGTKSMQEAAMERRKIQEEERLLKRARDDEKRREMEIKKEIERQKRDADKIAQKQEKMRRIEELKLSKQAEEEFFVRFVIDFWELTTYSAKNLKKSCKWALEGKKNKCVKSGSVQLQQTNRHESELPLFRLLERRPIVLVFAWCAMLK